MATAQHRVGRTLSNWLRTVVGAAAMALFPTVTVFQTAAAEPPLTPQLTIDAAMHTASITRVHAGVGGIVVTASHDKTVRVWGLEDGDLITTLRVPKDDGIDGTLQSAVLSPGGNIVMAGGATGMSWDGTFSAYLFRLPEGTLFYRLRNLPGPVGQLGYSRDGGLIALGLGGASPMLLVYDRNAALKATDDSYQGAVSWLEFSRDGRLVTTAEDGAIRIYGADLAPGRVVRASDGAIPVVARWSPDGRQIAVGYRTDGRIDILAGQDGSLIRSLRADDLRARDLGAVTWSVDGRLVFGGGDARRDGRSVIRIWSAADGTALDDLPAASDTILSLDTAADGRIVFGTADAAWGVVGTDRRMERILTRPGGDFRDMEGFGLRASTDGSIVELALQAGGGNTVRFDARRRTLAPIDSPDPTLTAARADGPGFRLENWKGSTSPTLNGTRIGFDQPHERALSAAVLPGGRRLLIGTDFGLYLFDQTGRTVARQRTPTAVQALGVSGDGARAVAAMGDGTVTWFETTRDDLAKVATLFIDTRNLTWVAWTADGRFAHAATGGQDLVGYHVNQGPQATPLWIDFRQLNRVSHVPEAPYQAISARATPASSAKPAAAPGPGQGPAANRPPAGSSTAAALQLLPPKIDLLEACPLKAGQREPVPESCIPARQATRAFTRLSAGTAMTKAGEAGAAATPAAGPAPAAAAAGKVQFGTDVEAVLIRFQIDARGSHIGDVDVFLNGRNVGRESGTRAFTRVNLVGAAATPPAAGSAQVTTGAPAQAPAGQAQGSGSPKIHERRILLDSGTNRIAVRVYNDTGVFGTAPEIEVERVAPAAPASKPVLHLVAIGVDQYQGDVTPLGFAVADARSVISLIRERFAESYLRVEVVELTDRQVTRAAVQQAMEAIALRAQPEDAVVIYMAGHGVLYEEKTYHYVTADVLSYGEIATKAVSQADLIAWLSRFRSRDLLLMLDTCHAGGIGTMKDTGTIANESGRFVLSAASSLELALDSYDNQNGVFAVAVMQGLNGLAVPRDVNTVDALSLANFVRLRVPRLAEERNHVQEAEFRVQEGKQRQFPLTLVRQDP